MDEEFNIAFEDEMDALNDLEDDEDTVRVDTPATNSKRSLNFQTPTGRTQQIKNKLNTSFPTPLDSPVETTSRKRVKDDSYDDIPEDDEVDDILKDEGLPDLEPRKKRQKGVPVIDPDIAAELENFEITPPPSPTHKPQNKKKQDADDIFRDLTNRLDTAHREDLVTVVDYDFDRPRVLSRIPSGDYISATGEEGKRVYMSLKDDSNLRKEVEESVLSGNRSLHLLGAPMEVLLEQVNKMRHDKLLAESERLTSEINRAIDPDTGYEEVMEAPVDSDDDAEPEMNLWVEKYSPRGYTELLSDEGTNRTMLRWLKQWDCLVFGKEKKQIKKKDQKQDKNKYKKNFKKFQTEMIEELDQFDRPFHKIALLCGPPGLGKTTLAHIIAKHAGYNAVEMNASDDRSAEAFRTKIEAATGMRAVLGADPRPNCLIIDEIDGAPQAAINVLLNVIKRTEPAAAKKKKKDGGLLLRPIICICNDQYVPALRPLRQLAVVFNFPPTESTKLAGRLYQISRLETLSCDMNALMQLCEKTENDIRSCINTLQFLRKQKRELTLNAIQSLGIGQKDSHRTLFSVWQEIFRMPRLKRKRFVNPHDRDTSGVMTDDPLTAAWNQNNTTPTARFHNILHSVYAAEDFDKLVQGLYENYLEVKFKDPRFEGVNLANEWLCFTDVLSKEILLHQNWILARYRSYLPVTFHLLFASNASSKLQFPSSQVEFNSKRQKSTNLVTSLMNDMTPSVRKNLNVQTTVMEALPPLLDIIQPTLRPVNTQLYSAREKEELSTLIRTMIAYNLTYIQEKDQDGQYTYLLDPNMDFVARFPGMKQHRQLTYAAKQLIAREIDVEKMRRAEATVYTTYTANEPVNPAKNSSGSKNEPVVPNYMKQKLEPKSITPQAEKPVLDFFGRQVVKKKTPESNKKDDTKELLNTVIWFRFKAGFSNAVRKTVKIQDLL